MVHCAGTKKFTNFRQQKIYQIFIVVNLGGTCCDEPNLMDPVDQSPDDRTHSDVEFGENSRGKVGPSSR